MPKTVSTPEVMRQMTWSIVNQHSTRLIFTAKLPTSGIRHRSLKSVQAMRLPVNYSLELKIVMNLPQNKATRKKTHHGRVEKAGLPGAKLLGSAILYRKQGA